MSTCDCEACRAIDADASNDTGLILPGLPPRDPGTPELDHRPAIERAAERWELARARMASPCGCVVLAMETGKPARMVMGCETHRPYP